MSYFNLEFDFAAQATLVTAQCLGITIYQHKRKILPGAFCENDGNAFLAIPYHDTAISVIDEKLTCCIHKGVHFHRILRDDQKIILFVAYDCENEQQIMWRW